MLIAALIVIHGCSVLSHIDADCSISNCKQCNGASQCEACNDGYFIQGGACHQCLSFCALCSNYSSCDSCKSTYWGLNQRCPYNCSADCIDRKCDDITGDCHECKPGKYGKRCIQDCTQCRYEKCNLRQCVNGCKDGYVQYNTDTGDSQCVLCPEMCVTCLNETYCIQCKDGYYRHYKRIPPSGKGEMRCWSCVNSSFSCLTYMHCEDCQLNSTHGCNTSERCLHADSDSDVTSINISATTKLTTEAKPPTGATMEQTMEQTIIKTTTTTKAATGTFIELADTQTTRTTDALKTATGTTMQQTTKQTTQRVTTKTTTVAEEQTEKIPTNEDDSVGDNFILILGAGAGGGALVVLLIVVIVTVVCFIKRRKRKEEVTAAQANGFINVRYERRSGDHPLYAQPVEQSASITYTEGPHEDYLYAQPNKPGRASPGSRALEDVDEQQRVTRGTVDVGIHMEPVEETNQYDHFNQYDHLQWL